MVTMMPTPPLVSVVIPLYNHEQFIVKCLDSILDDPYPNKEIIVIDDGSRDSSVEAVRQWHAAHADTLQSGFTLITRENRGLTKTLNELVGLAKGDFIAVLASDDYLLPGGIAARVSYLELNRNRLAVIGDCILVDYDGAVSHKSGLSDLHDGTKSNLKDAQLVSYEIVFNWCVPGPVFMARKEAYELIGGYDERIAVEDWDFYLRLVARDLLGFIDQPVAAYRIRPDEAAREVTVQQHIRFNEAMVQTVINNLPNFTGLKKAYLFAEKLKFSGMLERYKGNESISSFLSRKAGRILVVILGKTYAIWARLTLASTPKREQV